MSVQITPWKRVIAVLLTGASCALAAHRLDARSGTHYRLRELRPLGESDQAVATALNADGIVVGYAYRYVPPGHLNSLLSEPHLWERGKPRLLRTLGGKFGKALTVNRRGDVGGYAEDVRGLGRPVIWRRARNYQPEALTEETGSVDVLADEGTLAAYLPGPTLRTSTGATLLQAPNQGKIRITGIGSDRTVVGHTYEPSGFLLYGGEQAFTWREGRPAPLPALGGKKSVARGVARDGRVFGWADNAAGEAQACIWQAGKPRAVPGPRSARGAVTGINRGGAVVGITEFKSGELEPCIWIGGTVHELKKLTRGADAWSFNGAEALNDRGQIVISAYSKHRYRAPLLLTPE